LEKGNVIYQSGNESVNCRPDHDEIMIPVISAFARVSPTSAALRPQTRNGGKSTPRSDTPGELLRGLPVDVAGRPVGRRTMAELRRIVTSSDAGCGPKSDIQPVR